MTEQEKHKKQEYSTSINGDAKGPVISGQFMGAVATHGGKSIDLRGSTGVAIGEGATSIVNQHFPGQISNPKPSFFVPFASNQNFVGRKQHLEQIHTMLQNAKESHLKPLALTGMAGVGKMQLAVEYAYRFQKSYPHGVYWINAARNWQTELAIVAESIGIRVQSGFSVADYHLLLAIEFTKFLNENPGSLLIFDNVSDPRELLTPKPGVVIAQLECKILITTRRKNLNRKHFQIMEVGTLSKDSCLELLHSRDTWRAHTGSVQEGNPEGEAAKSICKFLGHLPLAITLAAAYLAKYSDVSLSEYLDRLYQEGGLDVLDATGLDELDLATRHSVATTTIFQSQWDSLNDNNAQLILQTASVIGDLVKIDTRRLAFFSGLHSQKRRGYPAVFRKALLQLRDLWLVEMLNKDEIRIHPLIREFANRTIPDQISFIDSCVTHVLDKLSSIRFLEAKVADRGVQAVIEDLHLAQDLTRKISSHLETYRNEQRAETLLRPLSCEAHQLLSWDSDAQPDFFLQQFRNRCLELGLDEMLILSEERLASKQRAAYLRERFKTNSESNLLIRTLAGHSYSVNRAIITSDGQAVISASADGTVRIWDLRTGRTLRIIEGHLAPINDVVISRNQAIAITASADATIGIWEFSTGTCLRRIKGHESFVNTVDISSDGEILASASADQTVKLWCVSTGKLMRTLSGHLNYVQYAMFVNKLDLVVSSDADSVRLWNFKTGKLIHRIKFDMDSIGCIAQTLDENLLLIANQRLLHLWQVQPIEHIKSFDTCRDPIHAVTFTPDGKHILTASSDNSVYNWRLKDWSLVRSFRAHSNTILDIAVTPDNTVGVTASADKTLKSWDLTANHIKESPRGQHRDSITKVATFGDQAISASWDCTLKMWNLGTGRVVRTLDQHIDRVTGVCLLDNPRFAVSCSADETLIIWDLKTGKAKNTFYGHKDYVRSVIVLKRQKQIISASGDQTLRVWDITSGNTIAVLRCHTDAVLDVAATPDERTVISASMDSTLKAWNLETGDLVKTMAGHQGRVSDVVITPDGRYAVSGSNDGTLRVWSLENFRTVSVLEGHKHWLRGLAISPSGRYVASTSWDNTLRIWELEAHREILKLSVEAALWCCEFAKNERTIVAGDVAGALHVIDWIK